MRSSTRSRSDGFTISAIMLVLLSGTGCLTPPALIPAREVNFPRAFGLYPAGTESVAIDAEPGVVLRGVFVPSDPGAPIVLHLLESAGSAASTENSYAALTQELSDLGFASMLVDYTGIGVSSGSASPEHLERDTQVMWKECVRRTGGHPERVFLRATSIGTLAAGALLASGARPGGAILLLPVMPHTVVRRFAQEFHGPIVAWFAATMYADVVDIDVVDVLGHAQVPLLAMSSPDEHFIDAAEHEQLRHAIEAAGGEWFDRPGGHLALTCEARGLFPQEVDFLHELFVPPAAERAQACLGALPPEVAARFADSSEYARLERLSAYADTRQPLRTASVALVIDDAREGWRVRRLLPRLSTGKSFKELCALCTLDDPAGPLPLDILEQNCLAMDMLDRFDMQLIHPSAAWIARAAKSEGNGFYLNMRVTLAGRVSVGTSIDARENWGALLRRGVTGTDAERQLGRLLLKSYGYADRLRANQDGSVSVEYFDDGRWQSFEPAQPGDPVDFKLHLPDLSHSAGSTQKQPPEQN